MVSWRERGRWRLPLAFEAAGFEIQTLCPALLGEPFPRFVRRLSEKLSNLYLPLRAFLTMSRKDVWLTWNLRLSVVVGLLKRLLAPVSPTPLHIARDFHLDFSRMHEPGYKLRLRLVALAIKGMDQILVTSHKEERLYAAMFGLPVERFRFLPDTPPGEFAETPDVPPGDYVFAHGASDRDFDALLAAAPLLDAPVRILSQTYTPAVPEPANVSLIRDYVSQAELIALIQGARCCVVPLKDRNVAAGQNSMLEVMALGRPLVITENLATVEYADDGESALFYQAGDAADLARCVRRILAAPEESEAMGQRARARAWKLGAEQFEILRDVLRDVTQRFSDYPEGS
jgi:glycosyltransferase involved in cell wall biosynthesis